MIFRREIKRCNVGVKGEEHHETQTACDKTAPSNEGASYGQLMVLAMGKASSTKKAPCPYIWVIAKRYWHRSEGVTASAPFLSFFHVLFGWFLFYTVPDHPFVLDNKWKRIRNVSYCKLLH